MSKVIGCIDIFNHAAETVCDYAAWSSLKMDSAPLVLLHVIEKNAKVADANLSGSIGLGTRENLLDELAKLDEQKAKIQKEQGRLMLKEAEQRAISDGVTAPELLQLHGGLLESLSDLEDEMRLLVMGREGGLASSVSHIGSHLESVIRTLHKPILVTVGDFKKPSSFVLAYDASPTAKKIVERVANSPLLVGLDCTLLNVGAETSVQQEQLAEAASILESKGFKVSKEIRSGEVDEVISKVITDKNIDLLVMGAYGHSRIRQFIVGSVTAKLLLKSPVPVLLLR